MQLRHPARAPLGVAFVTLLIASFVSAAGCAQLPRPFAKSGEVHVDEATKKFSMARLLENGQPAESRKIYNELIAKKQKVQDCNHRLAVMAVVDSQFEQADEYFRKAWAAGEPNVKLLNDMGYTLYLEHRLPEAEAVLRDALKLDPRHEKATNHLAIVVGQQGRYDESLEIFRRILPEAEAQANVGYLRAQQGELAAAKEHLSKALTLDDTLKPAAEALVQLRLREKVQADDAAKQNGPATTETNDEIWIDPTAPANMQQIMAAQSGPAPQATDPQLMLPAQPMNLPQAANAAQPMNAAAPYPVTPASYQQPARSQPHGGYSAAQPMNTAQPIPAFAPPSPSAPYGGMTTGFVGPAPYSPPVQPPTSGVHITNIQPITSGQ